MKIVLATRNPGKLREFRQIWPEIEALSDLPEIEETGTTFAENALLKARAAAAHARCRALGEDSGIVVDALGGRPGVYSARYGGNDRLLEEMRDVPYGRRTARYVAHLVLVDAAGVVLAEAEGRCEGAIAPAPRGSGGFGYDPIFELSDGRTMAELAPEEKNAISHRGRAIRTLLGIVRMNLDSPPPSR